MPARPPTDQIVAGKAFFAGIGLAVGHFEALWHSFKVGQLLETELNRISARHALSIADFHLLGALMMAPEPLRATDLSLALNVSNAVLSGRVRKLAQGGLLVRSASTRDRRAVLLTLTAAGIEKVIAIGLALERESRFAARYRALPPDDRAALARIMGEMHIALDRDFVPTARPDI